MDFKLSEIIPWGRSIVEYRQMFNLTADQSFGSILDCGGGPASFNAQMSAQGHQVISIDPIYQFTVNDIKQRIDEIYQQVIDGVSRNYHRYNWTNFTTVEELGKTRLQAMNLFLDDLPLGLKEGRYIIGELPSLPIADQRFDLALCSHLLFTYSDLLDLNFHYRSIVELIRVAPEIRIFPLLNISGEKSIHLDPLIDLLLKDNYQVKIETVNYEFQISGNQQMIINR